MIAVLLLVFLLVFVNIAVISFFAQRIAVLEERLLEVTKVVCETHQHMLGQRESLIAALTALGENVSGAVDRALAEMRRRRSAN